MKMIMEQVKMLEQNYTRQISVTSTIYDNKFICCEPADSVASEGWGITYDNSWTADAIGGIDQIQFIYYYD